MALPTARAESQPPKATPTPTPTPVAPTASPETASTTPASTPGPSETPAPSAEATASVGPTIEPSQSAEPSPTAEPSPVVTPVPTPPGLETPSPEPTVALKLAIASGVTVVGESAAFSADGGWFAFTARPADGSAGPDIYVWHVGDAVARRLTTDGLSVFASWDGNDIIGSGPAPDDQNDGQHESVSFRLDPASGERTRCLERALAPGRRSERHVRGGVGRLRPGAGRRRQGRHPGPRRPADRPLAGGRDVIEHRWRPDPGCLRRDRRLRRPLGRDRLVARDLDRRTGRSGDRPADALRLDRDSGRLSRPDGAPTDVPALPGFSIGDGRLAWVTPHGQDAQGSKVQVVAWSEDGVGATESVPGEGVVVVR